MEIPLNNLGRALRRFSYVDNIDVTQNADYLILKWFDGIKDMARYVIPVRKLEDFNPDVVKSWEKKFMGKRALLLARRLYLSSPGTCLIAFYSDEPTVGIDLWSLRNLDRNEAKIMALWLNSSINILQLLYMGVACEGPWMKLHNYMLKRLLAPDPGKLTKKERKQLMKVFDEIKDFSFPSIKEQLKGDIEARKTIDKTWLKILNYEGDPEELLKKLYASIMQELKIIDELTH
ncbi:hypothetical protein J7L70_08095 [Candidatus Bathyarchaeota archaeon]|nr:hypothetical protein [Candidatus Bathyarchaeota archaeon]